MPYNFASLMKAGLPDVAPDTKKPGAGLFAELGILSPSEKLQQQLQQQQAEQAQQMLQQQIAAQAQSAQLAQANAKAGVPGGYGFSQFQAMGGLMNLQKGDRYADQAAQGMGRRPTNLAPQAPGSDTDGIASQVVSQALQQFPNDKAKALRVAGQQLSALGANRQDQNLQSIGANLFQAAAKADKEQADLRKQQVDTNKETGPESVETRRAANGDIMSFRRVRDANGNYVTDEQLGGGPNKQITTTEEDPRVQAQKGAEYSKFQDLLVNTDDTVSSMRDITDNLEKGAAQGWAANLVGLVDNAAGTLGQLAPNSKLTSSATQALEATKGTFAEWAKKTGVNESIWNDLVSNLAKTYNPTGTITEKDITRAAKTVGQNISNPATVAAVLKDAERRTRAHVDKTYSYMGDAARAASKTQYERFLQKWTPGATGGESDPSDNMDDGAKASAEPSWDDAPAGTPSPKNEKEYDALPPGTLYWNPYKRKQMKKK